MPVRARMRPQLAALLLGAAACAPSAASQPPTALDAAAPAPSGSTTRPPDRQLDRRVRIFDRDGAELDLAAMLDRLATYDAVFLGETHLDDTTHRVELAVLEGLADRRDDRLVLSLEMFERDVQPAVDAYLKGQRDEAAFLAEARPWGNYRTDYRPLVETARARALPIVAANLPRPLFGRLSELGGLGDRANAAFDALRAEHPDWLPAVVHAPDEAYWARVGRVLRGHGPAPGSAPGNASDPRWSIQNLWDNTMADACAQALDRAEGVAVLHVVGAFHVQYFGGTVAQLRKRRPDAKIATLTVVPVDDLTTTQPRGELADFVVYAQSYAEGVSGGKLSVTVASELDWRLHAPDRADAPLLVWLGDDAEASADTLLRWRLALGEDAAVIVVEPPLRQREEDGRIARRWAWPTTFGEDQRPVQLGLSRILEYATRRLPIAKDRIVVAGHGAGASSVLWAALYERAPFVPVHAFAPILPRALQRAAVPEDPPGARSIAIHDPDPGRAALTQTLEAFTRAGATPTLRAIDATKLAREEERLVREALGLAPEPDRVRTGTILLTTDTPTGRTWADLVAAGMRDAGTPVDVAIGRPPKGGIVLDEAWLSARFADGVGLPKPEAAFGGATILVLPDPATRAQRDAWSAIVEKASAHRGRFSPLRLSTRTDLREQIAALASAGSADILVVPLHFAAPIARMRALHEAAGQPPETVTLHWLPGLGGAAAHRAALPAP